LFVFTRDFHDCAEWDRLFRQLATLIGVPVQKGVVEIFPSETRGRVGYGIRVPGTWNPKYDTFGLIAFENISPLLSEINGRERSSLFLSRSTSTSKEAQFTYKQKKGCYRGENDEWQTQFAITALSTRREKMKALATHVFRQVGAETALTNTELQYNEATVGMNATLAEHLNEFRAVWRWLETEWLDELSLAERARFDALNTQHEHDAFRIVRSFGRLAEQRGEEDFRIVCEHLAARVGITLQGASKIRRKLAAIRAIEMTAQYVPNKLAARFRWQPHLEPEELHFR
jgi:hypothetical protein